MICAVLSGLAAWYFFITPLHSFALDGSVVSALVLYTFVVSIDIVLIHHLRLTRTDLRHSRETEKQLAEKTALLDMALQGAKAGTWTYYVQSGRVMLSAEMARQHGLGEDEIEVDAVRDWQPLIHPVDAVQTLAALADAIANRERFQSEFRVVLPGGRFRWLSSTGYVEIDVSGEPARVCGMSFDITARKEAEEQISVLARHDGLTGLANRTSFQERFVTEMAGVRRRQASFALLCLDLDRFKAVNDTLGHLAGDALLLAVAERIKAETGLNDLVARIGGDEFVIIQSGAAQAQVASALAERIIRAIAQPVSIEGRPVQVGVSIGIALAPNDGCSCHDLYKSADGALYRAKHEGRNTFRFAEATATEIETRLAS